MIPQNHFSVLVYSKEDKEVSLLDKDLNLISSIKSDYFSPINIFYLENNKYLISSREFDLFGAITMKIHTYDFDKKEKAFLINTEYGHFIDVVKKHQ